LAALRRQKLVHGDLSARNILITPQGRAILADFGCAVRRGGRAVAVSDAACTPEHLRGGDLTVASDRFALGLLLHRMLTGTHPFERSEGGLDGSRLRRGLMQPPELPLLPDPTREAVGELLCQLLASDPDRRPRTFAIRETLRAARAQVEPARGYGAVATMLGNRALEDPAAPADVPKRLLHLPWWRHLQAGLGAYWTTGSVGARGLLLVLLGIPLTLGALVAAQPGPCIGIDPPQRLGEFPGFVAAPTASLHRMLTGAVKGAWPDATVLGVGAASDSQAVITPIGDHDICVPRRRAALQLTCTPERCLLELTSTDRARALRNQMDLPRTTSRRELRRLLGQMARGQTAVLYGDPGP